MWVVVPYDADHVFSIVVVTEQGIGGVMNKSTVESIIDELRDLATNLDSVSDISDVDMALMYLRHLRRRRPEPVLAMV